MKKSVYILLSTFVFTFSSFAQIKQKFFLTPFIGYFMYDKQRHIGSNLGGGINLGYMFTGKKGVEFLFGFTKTGSHSTTETVFTYSINFLRLFKNEQSKLRPYIVYGIGGNRHVQLLNGLDFGFGIKYISFQNYLSIDLSARGYYLWNGRLDGLITIGFGYYFK